jgi:hypothetical protein
MDLAVSLEDSLKQQCLWWKGSKDPRTRGFKTGLNISGDVVQGRNIKQVAKSRLKSTGGKTYSRKLWTR